MIMAKMCDSFLQKTTHKFDFWYQNDQSFQQKQTDKAKY